MKTVHELRLEGCKVRVRHVRTTNNDVVSTKGGTTLVDVRLPDGTELHGESRCNPKADSYCKKRGLQIALGRALVGSK